MTPREKAKELFNKYYLLIDIKNYENTKNCALIAVDEILSFIEDDRNGFNWKTYYIEVKEEIEKL